MAALLVGEEGCVFGVDLTPAMVEKARANARLAGDRNVRVCEGHIAKLPLPDACADVVISNGTINLSPSKPCVLKEAFRVLKPGGRLYIADMVRAPSDESKETGPSDSWADCVAGTLAPGRFVRMMVAAGFVETKLVKTTGYRTSESTVGAMFYAEKPRPLFAGAGRGRLCAYGPPGRSNARSRRH